MKIIFKNGKELDVTDEIVGILYEQIVATGSTIFQSFTNRATGKIDLIINIAEISHIVRTGS